MAPINLRKSLPVGRFSAHSISFCSKTLKLATWPSSKDTQGFPETHTAERVLWGSDDGCARLKLNVQSLAYHRHSLTACTCRIPIIWANDRSLPSFPPRSCETEWSLSVVGLSSALTAHTVMFEATYLHKHCLKWNGKMKMTTCLPTCHRSHIGPFGIRSLLIIALQPFKCSEPQSNKEVLYFYMIMYDCVAHCCS